MTALQQIETPFLDSANLMRPMVRPLVRAVVISTELATTVRIRSAVAAGLAGWTREQFLLRGELEVTRLRAEQAEARVQAMEHSLLWRAAAPFRRLAARLAGRARDDARANRHGLGRRLRRTAGPGRVGVKGVARMAFYAVGGAFLRVPGGALLFGQMRRAFPGPGTWLALRYRAYRRSAWRGAQPVGPICFNPALPPSLEEMRLLMTLRARKRMT